MWEIMFLNIPRDNFLYLVHSGCMDQSGQMEKTGVLTRQSTYTRADSILQSSFNASSFDMLISRSSLSLVPRATHIYLRCQKNCGGERDR